MKIKPSSCRHFPLRSDKPSNVPYKIGDDPFPSIEEVLGEIFILCRKSKECFKYLERKILEKMETLDKTEIRSEYKLEIYSIYILSSIRFLLTVHDLPKT